MPVRTWDQAIGRSRRLDAVPAVGTVVRCADGTRGIVVDRVQTSPMPMYEDDFVVHVGAGHWRITNRSGDWERVPNEELTALERVRTARIRWHGEEWEASIEWHTLAALLPLGRLDELTGPCCDWPDEQDLAVAVAEYIDTATSGQPTPSPDGGNGPEAAAP